MFTIQESCCIFIQWYDTSSRTFSRRRIAPLMFPEMTRILNLLDRSPLLLVGKLTNNLSGRTSHSFNNLCSLPSLHKPGLRISISLFSFPEEFRLFFTGNPSAKKMFEKYHQDLYQVAFWRGLQEDIRLGKVADMFPYRRKKRFHR